MSESASNRASMRASTFLNRPHIAPMGPRTRQSSLRVSHILDVSHFTSPPAPTGLALPEFGGTDPPMSPISFQGTSSSHSPEPSMLSPGLSLDVLEEEPSSPEGSQDSTRHDIISLEDHIATPSQPSNHSRQSSVTSLQEEHSERSPAYVPREDAGHATAPVQLDPPTASSYNSVSALQDAPPSPEMSPAYLSDDSILEPETETEPEPEPEPEPVPFHKPKVVAIPVPPKLVPPPALTFQTSPVAWKGLPMEAALWTVDSRELQELVSRAIRASARESFIRLLTLDNLDTILPAELARLDDLKARTQSRYRFLAHRRTMLFHALNSTNLSQQKDGDDGVSAVSRLASQLAETVTECEQHIEEVMNINDQVAQINKLIDLHWGSALAIALRKLNGSYARRTADLQEKKERIKQLEAELEDAWKEAEKMAGELDDYEAAIEADNTEAIIETAEIVPVPATGTPSMSRRASVPMPMTPTLLAITSPTSASPRGSLSPVSPVAGPSSPYFAFPPAITLKAKDTEATDVPDTVSVRSTRSTKSGRSRKSSWTADSTHTNQVHAAKKRSQRASASSLRLNTGHIRRQSRGHNKTPPEEKPPVPELPIQFAAFNGTVASAGANAASALQVLAKTSPLRRQISLDSVLTSGTRHPTTASVYRGRAADDLYVQPQKPTTEADIEIVPRAPGPLQNFSVMYQSVLPSHAPPKDPSKTIPSMWMNADAVKAPSVQPAPSMASSQQISTIESSERVDAPEAVKRQPSTRNSTYSKLRGLTKRYSISLPLFNSTKPSQTWSIPRRSG